MRDKTYIRWINLHNNPDLRKKLPDIVFDSWKRSYELGVNAKDSIPLISKEKELNYSNEKWRLLHFYANDIISKNSKNFNNVNIAFALFDTDGCLVKLYGNKESLQWLKENNIEENSLWTEELIGTNAISLGLKFKKPISILGEQHFSKFAINLAMYFSPFDFDENSKIHHNYSGVAVIVPFENNSYTFSIISDAFAKSVTLYLYWFESTKVFINSVIGYLIVTQSNNENTITFISEPTCNLFKKTFDNIQHRNLEEIIDPYPKNKIFWKLLSDKSKVENTNINLSVQGNPILANISICHFGKESSNIPKRVSIILNSYEKPQSSPLSTTQDNNSNFTFSKIIGQDEQFLNILSQANSAAQSDINVLLLGESGVGKDIVAQSIHNASNRKDEPFIVVNCASFPKNLIASELFGYDEGAFTGSRKGGYIGKFQLANHGTIFLDEIGDMPLELQPMLLRIIEQKGLMKVGSNIFTNLDIRIIAATNNNLKEKIKHGEFREDLYYRLGVIKLTIPPLRDRKDDILLLTDHFIEDVCKRNNKSLVTLSPKAKDLLVKYYWPGNVRELKNSIEGIIQIYNSSIITYEHIKSYITDDFPLEKDDSSKYNCPTIQSNIPDTKEYIMNALDFNKNNKTDTAKYLGISRNTLYRRLRKYNLL